MSVIPFEKSFASHPKSKFWNYERNQGVKPRDVFMASNKKFWFTCQKCNHLFEKILSGITRKSGVNWCPFCANKKLCKDNVCELCFEKSFASHPRSEFWNYDRNGGKKPRDNFLCSYKKYSFKCENCSHSFEIRLSSITNKSKESWCSFCSNRKLCDNEACEICFEKSFVSHPKSKFWDYERNGSVKPENVFMASNKKFWFTCQKCNHSFEKILSSITYNNRDGQHPYCWCPFCANQKLCKDNDCDLCFEKSFASHPRSEFWNFEKNRGIAPRDIFKNSSNKKYFFDCRGCKFSFEVKPSNVTKKNYTWCPFCKHKTEKKVYEYLLSLQADETFGIIILIKEYRVEWCVNEKTGRKLPFDFYVKVIRNGKIYHKIIEVDGRQHFETIGLWKNCPVKAKDRDVYKMICAGNYYHSVMRIFQEDILFDKVDWKHYIQEYILEESPRTYSSQTEDDTKTPIGLVSDVFVSSNLDMYQNMWLSLPQVRLVFVENEE